MYIKDKIPPQLYIDFFFLVRNMHISDEVKKKKKKEEKLSENIKKEKK